MKNLVKFRLLAIVLANVFIIISGLSMVGSQILIDNQGVINNALNLITQEIVTEGDEDEDVDNVYYKSSYNSVAQLIENAQEVAQSVVAEGSALLKNNNALPLAKGSKVSLFSVSSVDLVYCGSGSSATTTGREVKLKDGLERNGNLSVNPALWNWYTANYNKYKKEGPTDITAQAAVYAPVDATWAQIEPAANKTDATYGDAAIFVLSRLGGESDDLIFNNTSGEAGSKGVISNGNVLELSPNEKDVLANLKALKGSTFQKIIVLMNSANPVQCDFADDPEYGVDALIWCGNLGEVGANALGDLLVGNINFSGKTSDTFFKKHAYNPVYANWGPKTHSGTALNVGGSSNYYTVYQEGIYNGYRYTETRYEDAVMGRANTGSFDYDEVVSYPFGFGLSYTSFEYSGFAVSYHAPTDMYTVKVTVKNVGDVSGKEAVQIYLQKPYTQYDIDNKVEKAAVDLVGFAKTDTLGKGVSEELIITVSGADFASYDSNGAKTYILDAGDYYLTAAKDAHAAINNILAVKGKTPDNGVTTAEATKFVYKKNVATFDKTTYATSAVTGKAITNQFDNTDLNKYEGRGNNSVTYVSRNDWDGTVKFGASVAANGAQTALNNHVVITTTPQMQTDGAKPVVQKSDDNYPTYRDESVESDGKLISMLGRLSDDLNADGNLSMQVIAYDDPMWDDLLDQLSWNDTVALLSDGFRRTMGLASIGKPITVDPNGANGLVGASGLKNNYEMTDGNRGLATQTNDPDKGKKPVVYPANGLVASTFDKKLAKEVGRIWGEDCLWAGVSGLYGTGINMHRGAHAGRAFEYYGEDGVLAGQISAQVTVGLKAKGVYSYLKHCFLNDMEARREGVCTWANEQSIREIYLKPFEIAIQEMNGDTCIMTGFNRLGVVWTGHQGFMNTVLRDEYGMTGFAVSDYWQSGYMTVAGGVMAGNDLPDGTDTSLSGYGPGNGYGELARAMRESAKRILYTTVQSNAMNGITTNTRIIIHDNSNWQAPLQAAVIVICVLTALIVLASVALLVVVELQKKGIIKIKE